MVVTAYAQPPPTALHITPGFVQFPISLNPPYLLYRVQEMLVGGVF
jgi:hypothetical protein